MRNNLCRWCSSVCTYRHFYSFYLAFLPLFRFLSLLSFLSLSSPFCSNLYILVAQGDMANFLKPPATEATQQLAVQERIEQNTANLLAGLPDFPLAAYPTDLADQIQKNLSPINIARGERLAHDTAVQLVAKLMGCLANHIGGRSTLLIHIRLAY